MGERELPVDAKLVRTTPRFAADDIPAALLSAHRIAPGVWGVLRVWSGRVWFSFDDEPTADALEVAEGGALVIPPERPHHLIVDGPVELDVSFYRDDEGVGDPSG